LGGKLSGILVVSVFEGAQVFTGRIPYPDVGIDSRVIQKVQKGKRPNKIENGHGVGLSDEIWALMERCWDPLPDKRPSMSEIVQELSNALDKRQVCDIVLFSLEETQIDIISASCDHFIHWQAK